MYHKAWDNGWSPAGDGWENIGGTFAGTPAVVSWGPGRMDIFAVGQDLGIWRKVWAQGWLPSVTGWEPLGGAFL
jgi:hypothetical protein